MVGITSYPPQRAPIRAFAPLIGLAVRSSGPWPPVDRRVNAGETSVVIELSEQTVIEQLVGRLSQKYPGLPPETILDVVRQHHARFDGRPVRDYIPLFVERGARHQLAQLTL